MTQQSIHIAALGIELQADAQGKFTAPTQIRVLPAGSFAAVDGRPGTNLAKGGTADGKWHLDAALAQRVIERVAALHTDVLMDYEHQSLLSRDNGKPAPASGWFKALEWRDPAQHGDQAGLWATDVSWTDAARAAIDAREYRYLSPVFAYDAQGRVLGLDSVALTNKPALDTLDPLVSRAALSHFYGDLEDDTLKPEEQIAALTQERDAAKTSLAALTTQVATLTQERDAAAAQVTALTQERDTLKTAAATAAAEAEKGKHAELMQAALTDGRLLPALKPWAEKQSLAALTEYLDTVKPVDLSRQAGKDGTNADGLTEQERAYCTRMGVTPEQFLAARKS